MKEIKAYLRISEVHDVVSSLEVAGFCCMTIMDVSGLGNLADPNRSKYSMEFLEKYTKMVRLELVCKDEDANTVVTIVQKNGCTKQHGDGIIFVLPVERAVKIRTNEEGENILQTPSRVK